MPSTYVYTSFVDDLVLSKSIAVGKTSRQTLLSRYRHYVVMVPGLLPIFLHGWEIKSGSGLGKRLAVSYLPIVYTMHHLEVDF